MKSLQYSAKRSQALIRGIVSQIVVIGLVLVAFQAWAVATEQYAPGRSGDLRQTWFLFPGDTKPRWITYEVINGLAIYEGDIVLGKANQLSESQTSAQPKGIGLEKAQVGRNQHWLHGVIPYTINSNLSATMRSRINDAINHWHINTSIRLITRTSQSDYVEFTSDDGCSSRVGKQGGKQTINLASSCSTGSIIHEIGHAVGLFHEQSRCDRDNYVTILWENIRDGKAFNFEKECEDGFDIGAYDYGSIMHYGPNAFSENDDPTIQATQPLPAGVVMGQRTALSTGDVSAVCRLYYDACQLRKWPGTFEGRLDGRRARLTITERSTTPDAAFFSVRLDDLDRSVVLDGEGKIRRNASAHVMEFANPLRSPDGQISKKLIKLFLHTWNTNYISGYDEWQGKNFGLAFSRGGFQAGAGNGSGLSSADWVSQWLGTYDGRLDGRRARLTITDPTLSKGVNFNVRLEDLDRGVVLTGKGRIKSGAPKHVMEFPSQLTSADGQIKKKLVKLFLHTWNTNYISGYDEWQGKNFGLAFSRSGLFIVQIPGVISRNAEESEVKRTDTEKTQVQIFDLQGRLLAQRMLSEGARELTTLDSNTLALANGVYFYVLIVRSADGQTVRTELKKTLVIR
jgi:astacin